MQNNKLIILKFLFIIFFCFIYLFLQSNYTFAIKRNEILLFMMKDSSKSHTFNQNINQTSLKNPQKIGKNIYTISFNGENERQQIENTLKNNPLVDSVEVNRQLQQHYLSEDPLEKEQWSLKAIRSDQTWNTLENGKEEIIVAVLDSGIDEGHPDLSNRLVPGYDFIEDRISFGDTDGHGTAVAGIIAANRSNGIGISGVSGNSSVYLMPLRITKDGVAYTSDMIKAIDYAIEKKVDVISISLGSIKRSYAEEAAINRALAAGILVIASAGNDGNSELNYPASYEGVISVGATNRWGQVSWFSQRNESIYIVAPGEDVLTTNNKNSYERLSGTSFSVPYVVGAAASLLTLDSNLSSQDIIYLLKDSAKDIYITGKDITSGWGLLNHYQASVMLGKSLKPIEKVYFSKRHSSAIVGESKEFSIGWSPEDAYVEKVYWLSDNPEVFSIDNEGVGKAWKQGVANLTALINPGDYQLKTKIDIFENIDIEKIEIITTSDELEVGTYVQCLTTWFPEEAQSPNISWTTNRPDIININENAVIQGLMPGRATIIAITDSGILDHKTIDVTPLNNEVQWKHHTETVKKDKVWNVIFNLPIDYESVNSKNLSIKDINGKALAITSTLDSDNKILKIQTDGYNSGEQYTLFIGPTIKALNEKQLNNSIRFTFEIDE